MTPDKHLDSRLDLEPDEEQTLQQSLLEDSEKIFQKAMTGYQIAQYDMRMEKLLFLEKCRTQELSKGSNEEYIDQQVDLYLVALDTELRQQREMAREALERVKDTRDALILLFVLEREFSSPTPHADALQ